MSFAIFAALVIFLPLFAAPYGSVDPWWASIFQAAIFSLSALWAVEGAFDGNWLSSDQLIALPPLILSLFAFIQSWTLSFDPYETRLAATEMAALAFALALFIRYTAGERRLRILIYAVIAVGAASAIFGILRQASQREALGFLLARLPKGSGYAQFINKNHFAYLAEMAFGLLAGLVVGGGVPRRKALIPLAFALPVWAALVLCNSRGGLFAMLCQIVFLCATFGITRTQRVSEARARGSHTQDRSLVERIAMSKAARAALSLALIAIIVVGMVWLGGDSLADRVASVGEEATASPTEATRTGRKDIWASAWEMFEQHPASGVGFGGFWIAISNYHKGSGGLVPQQAHNDYLEVLASGGFIGAIIIALFFVLLIRQAAPRLREGTAFERAAALGSLAGLFGVAVHSLVEFGLHTPSNAFVASALVAMATRRASGQKTKLARVLTPLD